MKGIEEPIDRCDAIDLLEEAVATRRPVTLVLRGGRRLTERVVEVRTEEGEDWACLADGTRIGVSEIRDVTRD